MMMGESGWFGETRMMEVRLGLGGERSEVVCCIGISPDLLNAVRCPADSSDDSDNDGRLL